MKPNIIFIMADQLAAGSIGCYGSRVGSSPALDRLANEGMKFTRCYTTATVCAPNRASMLTGRSPVIHGVVTNNLELTTDNPTYPQVLQALGYRTGGFGKFHHTCMGLPHPESFAHLGFDETMITEDPKWGNYLDWIKQDHPEHYQAALAMCWGLPFLDASLKTENAAAAAKFLKERRAQSDWPLMYSSPLPKELHQTTFITDKAIDFISRSAENPGHEPFCCFVSYVDPHDPYDPPAPYDTMFSPDDMPEPLPPAWTTSGNKVLKASQDFCDFKSIADNPQAVKKLRALYHGSIRFIDDQIARIVKLLDERNLADNTILVFTTDHGDMIGDHGLITKGVKFYDKGIRCPLIVHGKPVQAGISERLVCTLDFFPSFCDFAEIPASARPPLEGKSFAPECGGKANDDRWPEITVESPYQEGTNTVRGIVTDDQWRFTVFETPGTGEMFDLGSDPDEQDNLFDNPRFKDVKMKLFERLTHAFMRSHKVPQYRNLPVKDGRRCMLVRDWDLRDDIFNPAPAPVAESGSRSRRPLAQVLAGGLIALAMPILGAEPTTTSAPTELLADGNTSAAVCLPDATHGLYRGTRFDRGSMIQSLRFDGVECFTEWRHPDTHPEINGGAGPSEEFDFGLDGATAPQGYDEAKPGEAFLKIGVGWLKKEADKPYVPFFPFEVVDAGTWKTERGNAASIRIIHTTDPARKYAYRLTRTITVKADPPRLLIERELANTGSAPIKTSHYCHNFIRLGEEPVGPAYRLILPFPASFANSAPAGWNLSESILAFTELQKSPVGTQLVGVKMGETRNSFTIENLKSHVQLRGEGDRPLSAFTVFADAAILCPEPFVTLSVAPGESVTWTNTYEYKNLAVDEKASP